MKILFVIFAAIFLFSSVSVDKQNPPRPPATPGHFL